MPQLDGLRAFAVLLVMWHHWAEGYKFGIPMGMLGVQLFFVLSGFLITGILLRGREELDGTTGGLRRVLRNFYARRFLRIFPLYYGFLLLMAALSIAPVPRTLGWHLTYTSNIFFFTSKNGLQQGPTSHLWSLSVEEQFYLVWPWLILCVPARWLRRAVVAAIVLAPLFRIGLQLTWPGYEGPRILTPGATDSLGLGALLALLGVESAAGRRYLRWSIWLGLLAWTIPLFGSLGQRLVVREAYETLSLLVMVWLVGRAATGFQGRAGRALSHPLLVGIGTISYGLYVIHNFAPPLLRMLVAQLALPQRLLAQPALRLACLALLTFAMATASWLLYERPLNRLKRYFPYRGVAPGADSNEQTLREPDVQVQSSKFKAQS